MQELRAFELLDVLERRDQRLEVVAVDRADVVEAELLEQRGRHHQALGLLLEALGELEQMRSLGQHLLADLLGRRIEAPAHQLGQVTVQRPHRRADRHVIVVQDHQQLAVEHAGVVERLEGHAGGHRAVADDGDRLPVLALLAGRHRHAERGRDAGRGMRGAKGVVLALAAQRKTADAAGLAQAAHALAPAGQNFVRIGLMADVPDDAVLGRVEDIVQREGQLDRAEVGAQMTAGARHAVQQEVAQLGRQRGQLRTRQSAQIGRGIDGGQQTGHCSGFSSSEGRQKARRLACQ